MLASFLFVINALAAATLFFAGLTRRAGYLEAPFLAAAIYATWYLPQAAALLGDPSLPQGGLSIVLTMSALSLVAIAFGWHLGTQPHSRQRRPLSVPIDSLLLPTYAVTAFAVAMHILILAQPAAVRAQSQWTGPITILYFLSTVGIVSLVLSFAIALRRRNLQTVALLIINLANYFPEVLLLFRRAETFQLVFAALLAAYFLKNWTIPRGALIAACVLGFFFANGVGQLRALSGGYVLNNEGELSARMPTLDEVLEIDWLSAVDPTRSSTISETRNAVMSMQATTDAFNYSLGAELYNGFIFNYVPGQLVGYDFKQSLMIGQSLQELMQNSASYTPLQGTTSTGFAQSYRDFSFFGALVFAVIAYWMGRSFRAARNGSWVGFTIYASTLSLFIHSLTHYSYYYIINSLLPLAAIAAISLAVPPLKSAPRQPRALQA